MSNSSPDSSPDTESSRLVSDAIKLAVDISTEGVGNLSEFLSGITENVSSIAGKADDQLSKMPRERRDDLATRGGQLANDAVTVALDVARAASEEANKEPAQREQNLDALSQLVSFFGSMFIDTANKAVGTTAGQPPMSQPRQITVEVAPGRTKKSSAVVVNRGTSSVKEARVCVLVDAPTGLQIDWNPKVITIGPRGRLSVTLIVKGPDLKPGSFIDSLLLVEGVASIVVRTIIVEAPKESPAPKARARAKAKS